ncbi:MAG: restriction endonuclease, partial [Phycisphaeraceae bacterium JB051]
EYADVLGINFDFNAKPVVAKPQTPRQTVHVKAVSPDRDHCVITFPRVTGYRIEPPQERLTAKFDKDTSTLVLKPDMTGATETQNSGIIGEEVELNLIHTGDVRPSQVVYELTAHLMEKWEPGQSPKLHLFGQFKRIAKQWIDGYLKCVGGTFPAQLKYKMLADMACERIIAAITMSHLKTSPVKVVLDPYNPIGSTDQVNFTTSKLDRWDSFKGNRCHINWVITDSNWEAEFCRVAEKHPKTIAYVKNHNLGFEVPYQLGGESHVYIPDFIVLVDDGHGKDDPLHLVVEIKGYRGEDAKQKKATMDTYWIPGVNHMGTHGRWAFVEFCDVYEMQLDFEKKIESLFDKMIEGLSFPDCK